MICNLLTFVMDKQDKTHGNKQKLLIKEES